jgi:hypothetical protein
MSGIPYFLSKHINDLDKCVQINIGQQMGATGYIDFISPNHFTNTYTNINTDTNIVYGYDCINRFFISVLFCNEPFQHIPKVMTLFQRYVEDPYFFATCGNTFNKDKKNYMPNVTTHNFMYSKDMKDQIKHFFELINNGSVDINCEKYNENTNDYEIENTIKFELFTYETMLLAEV